MRLTRLQTEVLALVKVFGQSYAWQIAKALGRSHGVVIGSVADLVRRGLLKMEGPAFQRKRGRKQLVSLTEKGDQVLQPEWFPVRLLEAAAAEPIEEVLRMVLVAVVVFGEPGFYLLGRALDWRSSAVTVDRPEDDLRGFPAPRGALWRHVLIYMREQLSAAHRARLLWEEVFLRTLWPNLRQLFPDAAKVYQAVHDSADPVKTLRQILVRQYGHDGEDRKNHDYGSGRGA